MKLQQHYSDHGLFIANEWRDASSQDRYIALDPATEEVLGHVPQANSDDVVAALDAARRGLTAMSALTGWERAALLRKAAAFIRERAPELGKLAALELGKPVGQGVGEAIAAAESVDWFADEARRIHGMAYEGRSKQGRYLVQHEPIGIVAAFAPWNFPLLLMARKLAPALAAGNAVIARPADEAAGTTMLLIRCFADAGFPVGALNLLIGSPERIVPALMADSRVAKLSFTGSIPVGKLLAAQAASTLKRVTLELGGHAPVIVHADADVDGFVKQAVASKFRNAGQICTSPTRFLVHRSIYTQVVRKMVEQTRALRIGNPLGENVDVGPLTVARRRVDVEKMIDDARDSGAEILCGGRRPPEIERGFFYEPTLVASLKPDARLLNEEPFGPVGLLVPFAETAEAFAEANRLSVGLAAYVFTRSLRHAHEAADGLQAGVVGVNTFAAASAESVFGGVKESGYGREGGPLGIRDYMTTKFVNMEW